MKKIIYLFIVFSIVNSCTEKNNNTFYNKKLYILGGDKANPYFVSALTEVQLEFRDNDSVYITKTACFTKNPALKNLSDIPIVFHFTYKDSILSVRGYNLDNVKITETPNSYKNDLGIPLYKKSILDLSLNEQHERLMEIFGENYQPLIELLNHKYLLKDSKKTLIKEDISKPNNSNDSLNSLAVLNCKNVIDLQLVFGKENIKSEKYTNEEGEDVGISYTLFPNTENEVIVRFGDNQCLAEFHNSRSKWILPYGLKIGMSLSDLIKVNSRSIKFYGFEWDYAGEIDDWNNGELANKNINISLSADDNAENYIDFMGSKIFSSNDSGINKLDLHVASISLKSQ